MATAVKRKGRSAISRRDLAYKCVELRIRGESAYSIAQKLGVTEDKAAKLVSYDLAKRDAKANYKAEQLSLALIRLDEMQAAIYGQAIGDECVMMPDGDGGYTPVKMADDEKIKTVLLIMKQRSALLGLDAPKSMEVTGKDGGPLTIEMIDSCLRGDVTLPREMSDAPQRGRLPAPDPTPILDAEFTD